MSATPASPGQDRATPMGSFSVSLACGAGALAASAALVASAGSVGQALELFVVFAVLACLEAVAYVEAIRPWLDGASVPPGGRLAQLALVVLAFATFVGGPAMGAVGLCGFAAGVFVPNTSSIRYRRVNRSLVVEGETRPVAGKSPDAAAPAAPAAPADRPARARAAPKVGRVLRAAVNEERDRWLAWAAATFAVTVGCAAARTSGSVVLGVDFLGVAALVWVTRRALAARLALGDFEEARTEPRRGFVALVRDPHLPGTRPLLGVWSKEPVPVGGQLPRAEAVYRCDAARDALFSTRGAVVVHQAWVGAPSGSRPRWVVADAGIALPRHRALLGPHRLDSVIGTERPARARTLSMPAPNPTTEAETGMFVTVISEPTSGTGPWARLFAWRLAALALAGAVLAWLR
ncbi:MAG: hypothetical protein ABIW17_04255 [Marmoricola sp.]